MSNEATVIAVTALPPGWVNVFLDFTGILRAEPCAVALLLRDDQTGDTRAMPAVSPGTRGWTQFVEARACDGFHMTTTAERWDYIKDEEQASIEREIVDAEALILEELVTDELRPAPFIVDSLGRVGDVAKLRLLRNGVIESDGDRDLRLTAESALSTVGHLQTDGGTSRG